jgi:hypothetical protein
MSERFIKYIPSEKASWLRQNYPNAFLLLSYIAENARRYADKEDGLEVGDVIIGRVETPKKCGLTEKEFRGALDKLIEFQYVEIVYSPKAEKSKTRKRAIKRAIKSLVVCLINSDIYDINSEDKGHISGFMRAIKGPQTKNVKNEKESSLRFYKKTKTNKEKIISVSFSSFQKEEIFNTLKIYLESKDFSISEAVLKRWVEKYPEVLLNETIGELVRKDEPAKNPEAWLEKTLANKDNFNKNYDFISEFKEKNTWSSMEILKNYCRDIDTGNEYYYKIPHMEFTAMIEQKFKQKEM